MEQHLRAAHDADCQVCLLEHDSEIHDATLSVHQWLRQELIRKLDASIDAPRPKAPTAKVA